MPLTLMVHIAAGAAAVALGFTALFVAKGGRLHRRSGLLFVYAMVVMGLTASIIGASPDNQNTVLGGLLPVYLVVTALTTVRPPSAGVRRVNIGAMLAAFAFGLTSVAAGAESLARGELVRNGVPVAMILFLGTIILLAAWSDLRILRSGPPKGARRLSRHVWRMCFALWSATGSFFLGQADEFPEAIRIPALLAIPAFLPLILMAYWLWRVRAGRRRIEGGGMPRMEVSDGLA